MFLKGDFNVKQSWAGKEDDKTKKPQDKVVAGDFKKKLPVPTEKKTDEDLTDMIDQDMSKRILKNFQDEGLFKKRDNPVIKSNSNVPIPKAKDNDMISIMAARLSKLEMTNHNQREEIREKSAVIERVQKEIGLLKSQVQGPDSIIKLKEDNEKLRQQIIDMEKFLNDYGLKWVGLDSKQAGSLDVNAINKDIDNQRLIYKTQLPKEIDIVILERRVEELNIIMEKEGVQQIVKDASGAHKFKKMESLPLAFYKNGMVVKGFPLFLYSSKEAQTAMQDILEGYFPSILKPKYPSGTLFKFMNKIDEDYSSKPFDGKMNDLSSIDENALKPQSKEEFLANLPKTVIKDGKIYNVRDEIAKKFDPSKKIDNAVSNPQENPIPGGVIEVETDFNKKEKENKLSDYEKENMTMLKVRSENGKYTLIVKLDADDNIGTLYKLLQKYSETKKFDVACNYPPQTFGNDGTSLKDLGLYPNSALQMKPSAS